MVSPFSWVIPAIALTLGATLRAAGLGDDQPSAAERLTTVRQEVADAEKEFRDAWAKLSDQQVEDPEVEKLYQAFKKKQEAGYATALEIAQADPKSDVGFEALEWMLKEPAGRHYPQVKPALELMAEHHAANP